MTDIRVTQDVIEAISFPSNNARISQDVIEIISSPPNSVRISQHVVEIISSSVASAVPVEKSFAFIDDLGVY